MKYVVDIDGTICVNATVGDYSSAEPFTSRIEKLNGLKKAGSTIVYFSARGMDTFNGDIERCKEEYLELTQSQLNAWGVDYDDIILGKPSGDFYIDDKGMSCHEFFY